MTVRVYITVPLKILNHCKWSPEIMTVPLKMYDFKCSFEITRRLKYKYLSIATLKVVHCTLYAASALLKNTASAEEWMATTTFVKKKKHCNLKLKTIN